MRTITLELLRHGPAHNQLLSPLTPYLALCENHAPVTVNLPFEHNQFLHRLTALTYEFGTSQLADNQRQFQLGDTGRELGRLISTIPGLTAELNRHCEQSSEVIHLRLVLSASELALLPFELVLAGNGCPGFGQPLLLQNHSPVCLTREVRRVQDVTLQWTPYARVLFVFASPAGLPAVPQEAHLLALRKAVDPWVGYFHEDDDDERRRRVDSCLHVLPAASIAAIQEACSTGQYSHVHVLAHGVARQDGFDLRFGIALHDEADPDGPPDVVSGDRLASALRPLVRPGRESFARPTVVTLASCHGANGGSVVGAGASVAHALQEAGIPLVVAGQFPLTFEGSVELVQTLYDGLLWGADPRALLMDLRRRMHVLQPRSHDWAALTAYASLPVDFDEQLADLVIARARTALNVAMEHADRVLVAATGSDPSQHPSPAAMQRARDRIERPWSTISTLIERLPKRRFMLLGLLASLCKRRAEIELASGMLFDRDGPTFHQRRDLCRTLLEQGRDAYHACFRERRDAGWAVVQYIGLSLLLEPSADGDAEQAIELRRRHRDELHRLWSLARALSLDELGENGERLGWALGNLIELPLLAVLMGRSESPDVVDWFEEAASRIDTLQRRNDAPPFQIYSTRRQLMRYVHWFPQVNSRFQSVVEMADLLLNRFLPDAFDADQSRLESV